MLFPSPDPLDVSLNVSVVCVHSCSVVLLRPLDYNPQGSSVHGVFQTRILECVAIFLLQWTLLLSPKYNIRSELKCIIPSFPGSTVVKDALPCRRFRRLGFDLWGRKMPWCRKWQPPQLFLSGKSHGLRNLAAYSLQSRKESGATEVTVHTCKWVENTAAVTKVLEVCKNHPSGHRTILYD